jgi:3-oxoacyl-[acyl-carrier-protein] synthase-3
MAIFCFNRLEKVLDLLTNSKIIYIINKYFEYQNSLGGKILGVRIVSTGKALPKLRVDNDRIQEFVETDSEWIKSRTGIEARHVAEEESALDIAVAAAKQALSGSSRGGVGGSKDVVNNPDDIGLVIFATLTPDMLVPSMASLLKKELGLANAVAFDLNAACSGFIFGTWVAQSLMKTAGIKKALVVGCERLSRVVNWEDRGTCILFGDGAGAAVYEMDEKFGIIDAYIKNYDDVNDALICGMNYRNTPFTKETPNNMYLEMNGNQVFRFAVSAVAEVMETLFERTKTKPEDIDFFVPHQANIRIINNIANKFDIPLEKFQISIENTGNTSAASVPMALDDLLRSGKVKEGDKIMLVGFGGGLSAGAILMEV